MKTGPEMKNFEALLRKRGFGAVPDVHAEKEILERYQDDCAVLVLDCSGFTRITQSKGVIHFLSLVVAMRDVIKPQFKAHDAIAWWHEADNLFAIFPTAFSALRSALAAQQAMYEANRVRESFNQMDVCIGLGSGKMLRIGTEDIYGDQMNLACKLGEDVARGREILITQAFYEEIKDRPEFKDLRFNPRKILASEVEILHYHVEYEHLTLATLKP
jgi:class 3 adenylate cyclase